MSKPENILSRFRTYSYHHILIACDNEASARYIRESNRLSTFRELSIARAVNIAEEDKKVDVSTIQESTTEEEQTQVGTYVVILNGMIDTAFVVRDLQWFSTTAASTDKHDRFTSNAVEGKMTIEEPRGVRFMNALNGACDLLQSDPTGVIWILKTIFVGHGVNDDGTTFSDNITDLRPLEFFMYDVAGTFDISGGVYEISFAGASNGAARFPQYSRVAQNISINPSDYKLSTVFGELQERMNENSRGNRACVIEALQRAYTRPPQRYSDIDTDTLNQLREVEYAIIPEFPYAEKTSVFGTVATENSQVSEYVIDSAPDQEKDMALSDTPPVLKFGPQSTVEQAIRHIMDRCSRVLKDRTEGDDKGIKYTWKVHSEITMVGKDTRNPLTKLVSDKDVVLVIYRIRRHAEVTNSVVTEVLRRRDEEPDEVTAQTIRDNLLELDYFFTGKNIDILDFDLKMEMGLAFLQTIGSTNNMGTGTGQIAGTETINASVIAANERARENPNVSRNGPDGQQQQPSGDVQPNIFIRSKTPIFPATNTNNISQKNIRGPLDSTLYNSYLTKHAALESVEALVTILGNPYLMSQTNRRGSDHDRKGNTSDENDLSKIMQNWDFIPGIAKVNIFMPSSNDTPSSGERFDREKFWYDGYYYIFAIDHKFAGGEFTQDLHLVSLPNESIVLEQQETDISNCGVQPIEEGDASDEQEPTSQEALATAHTAKVEELRRLSAGPGAT